MTIVDIINKKRLGNSLSYSELDYAFNGYNNGSIPDYQMSSLLMAICINGMDDEEILNLTNIFIKSGETLDLSSISGVTVDKHSTGGVGDKTTLVITPIVASVGVKVLKMSGKGLGHTGGTIDKLESIPGFNVNLSCEDAIDKVNNVGAAIISQTANLTPLDKKIYALRDVTGTVESIPLIAVSIMSKKIAAGSKKIVIDIKVGNGALLKSEDEALELSRIMKLIGSKYNRNVLTLLTPMDIPLGNNIGNSLEVLEAIKILKCEESNYLSKLCIELASNMISLAKDISLEEATALVNNSLTSGAAYNKFIEIVKSQGGDLSKLRVSSNCARVISNKTGIIKKINALAFGKLSVELGAGRLSKEDTIDYGVGIVLEKNIGDKVNVGDTLCTLYLKDSVNNITFNIDDYYVLEDE